MRVFKIEYYPLPPGDTETDTATYRTKNADAEGSHAEAREKMAELADVLTLRETGRDGQRVNYWMARLYCAGTEEAPCPDHMVSWKRVKVSRL